MYRVVFYHEPGNVLCTFAEDKHLEKLVDCIKHLRHGVHQDAQKNIYIIHVEGCKVTGAEGMLDFCSKNNIE